MRTTSFKTKISMAVLAIGILFISSCKKYFDTQSTSSLTYAQVFDNVPDAQKAVFGVYQDLAGDYGYGLNLSLYYCYDDDNMMGPLGNGDGSKKDMTHYVITSGTQASVLDYPFNQLYQGIERANNCIYYLPTMPDFNNPSSSNQAELHRLYGEALTLRAQYYFDLVKIWGDVPAQYLPSAETTDFYVPATNRDSIYDHILSDLQVAENMMPWYWQLPGNDGRLTQNAARGLRARIALFRGGWSLRADGTMQRGSNWQTYYQIAKAECDTVISTGQNSLNNSYQAIFKNGLCLGVYEPKEVLFQIGAAPGSATGGDSKLGIYDGPKSTVGGATAGSSGVLLLPTYFYTFDSTDVRRDVTCAPYTVGLSGTGTVLLTATKITGLSTGKFRRDWVPNGAGATGQYLSEAWPLIRYSDILLMDAEADNALNGAPSQTDITNLQLVQARAHGNNLGLVPPAPTDQVGFFNAIMKERGLEFGGEGLRKYDLIRWDSLASKIAATKINLVGFSTKTGFFNGYDLSKLPTSMYWSNTPTGGIQWNNSFYVKPATTPPGTSASWLGSGAASFLTYYATGFVTGQSELYPFANAVIAANSKILQNPNYH